MNVEIVVSVASGSWAFVTAPPSTLRLPVKHKRDRFLYLLQSVAPMCISCWRVVLPQDRTRNFEEEEESE